MSFKNLKNHLTTITIHRKYVRKMCFKMGIPFRGLIHDLSKYGLKELSIYKYYDGTRSPHEIARQQLGYSPSWLYHKARNKHHWEYWLDNAGNDVFIGVKIPYKYVIEMFCDYVGASKAYSGSNYTKSTPLIYHNEHKDRRIYHEQTLKLLECLLYNYNIEDTEKSFVKWYKKNKRKLKDDYNKGVL